jgi:hypothetical protein
MVIVREDNEVVGIRIENPNNFYVDDDTIIVCNPLASSGSQIETKNIKQVIGFACIGGGEKLPFF